MANNVQFTDQHFINNIERTSTAENLVLVGTSIFCNAAQQISYYYYYYYYYISLQNVKSIALVEFVKMFVTHDLKSLRDFHK